MSTDETYADAAKATPAPDNVVVDGPEGINADGAAAAPAEKEHPYTLKTLKEHNKRGDLWMLLHGKVYDVTKFMDEVCRLLERIDQGHLVVEMVRRALAAYVWTAGAVWA